MKSKPLPLELLNLLECSTQSQGVIRLKYSLHFCHDQRNILLSASTDDRAHNEVLLLFYFLPFLVQFHLHHLQLPLQAIYLILHVLSSHISFYFVVLLLRLHLFIHECNLILASSELTFQIIDI